MIWKDFSWKEDTVLRWCTRKYVGHDKFQEMFRHMKSQLKKLHLILACDEDHKKVFPKYQLIFSRKIRI